MIDGQAHCEHLLPNRIGYRITLKPEMGACVRLAVSGDAWPLFWPCICGRARLRI
jgi:hypothetical protein